MDMPLSQNHCFLCKIKLTNNTDEHIFPKWLQRKFNLWNQTVTLSNGTKIPYRILKVPYYNKYNNEYLSQLEIEMSNAVDGGFKSFIQLNDLKWHFGGKNNAEKSTFSIIYRNKTAIADGFTLRL